MLDVRIQTTATLDDKGRLSLPVELRGALEYRKVDRIVLHWFRGSIWGWTPDDYKRHAEGRLEGHDPFAPEVVDFVHAFLALNEEVKVDGAGRIRVPNELRELAGIDREVRIFSAAGRLELWDPGRWKQRLLEVQERGPTLPQLPATGGAA
jgi:MraZ protein